MSDLISRKKICDYIKGKINPYGKPFEGTAYELGLKIMRYIDAMDSAYSVDKVIEELNKLDVKAIKRYKGGTFGDYEGTDYYIKKSDAIEIVKQGGVSDDISREAKQGKWILDEFTAKYGNPYRCSCCNIEFGDTYNYCPNCGAGMKKVVE